MIALRVRRESVTCSHFHPPIVDKGFSRNHSPNGDHLDNQDILRVFPLTEEAQANPKQQLAGVTLIHKR